MFGHSVVMRSSAVFRISRYPSDIDIELLERKFKKRFAQLDADGDGFVEREDYMSQDQALRLIGGSPGTKIGFLAHDVGRFDDAIVP